MQWRNWREFGCPETGAPTPGGPPEKMTITFLLVHWENWPEPENLQRVAPKSRNCEIWTPHLFLVDMDGENFWKSSPPPANFFWEKIGKIGRAHLKIWRGTSGGCVTPQVYYTAVFEALTFPIFKIFWKRRAWFYATPKLHKAYNMRQNT